MAINDALEFVEGSEYRKEIARQFARRISAGIDLQALVEQGEGYTDELLEDLLRDMRAILRDAATASRTHAGVLGLSTIDGSRTARIVEDALEPVLEEAMEALGARVGELSRAVTRMLDDGVGDDVVRATLASEAGARGLLAPLNSVLTATGAGMVNAVEKTILEESVAQTHMDALTADQAPPLFAWQTREDDKVCEDVFENSCAPRHGEELPLDEWGVFGLPGSENTICSIYAKGAFSNCRCVLEAASNADRSPVPIKIDEAAARGRALAEEVFANAA